MKGLNVAKWISLLIGTLLLIGGIVNIANPVETTFSLVQIISVILIIIGVLRIFRYFSNRMFHSGVFLVGAIVDILAGIIIYKNIDFSVMAFTQLIAFWILFHGIIEISVSLDLRKFNLSRWWVALISGILGVIFGYLMITNSKLSTMYITLMISIYMGILGLTFISTFFALNKVNRLF